MILVDAEGRKIVYANAASETLLDWSQGLLKGKDLAQLQAGGENLLLDAHSARPGPAVAQLWRDSRGRTRELKISAAPLSDSNDCVAQWLLTLTAAADLSADEGSRTSAGAELIDTATGLPDRSAFDRLLAHDWGSARRQRRSVSLLLFEIDAFDAYRDVFGRHAADSCLRKVGHAISGCLRRDADCVARFGDGQFAAIVGAADKNQSQNFAERIADRVRLLAIHHPRSSVDRFVTVAHAVGVHQPGLNDSAEEFLTALQQCLPGSGDQVLRRQA